jgi:hypothetical protein
VFKIYNKGEGGMQMSDYRINFEGSISQKDASNLTQMLSLFDNGDKLTINIDNNFTKEIDDILKILYENGFESKAIGNVSNNNYLISASRKSENSFEGIH